MRKVLFPDPLIRRGPFFVLSVPQVLAVRQQRLHHLVRRRLERANFSPAGCAVPVRSRHAQTIQAVPDRIAVAVRGRPGTHRGDADGSGRNPAGGPGVSFSGTAAKREGAGAGERAGARAHRLCHQCAHKRGFVHGECGGAGSHVETYGEPPPAETRECAEVPFVPGEKTEKKDTRPLRYVAIRIRKQRGELFEDGSRARHFAVLSNRWEWKAPRLIE